MKYLIHPLKSYLAFLFLLISLFSFSQNTFYWIGGSGNWSDPQHWSNESGGQSVFRIPSKNDAVVFDDLSFFEPFSEIVIANGAKIQLESILDNTNYTSFEVKGLNLLLDVKESINLTARADFSAFQTIKMSSSKNGKINLESKKLIENLVIENGNYIVNAPSKIANLSINNSTTEVSGLLWANDIKMDKKSSINKSNSAKVLNFNNQVLNNNFQPAAAITNGGISTMAVGDIDSVKISPTSQTICPGTSVFFTATIFGQAPYNTPLTYEWYLTQGSTTLYATHVSNSATDTLTIPFSTGGTVTVFVTDANFNTVISNQSTISVPGVFVSTSTQQAICFGTNTGVATFTLIPPTPGTTFSVDNGPYVASNVATGLSPGSHNVRIITPAGCSGGPFSFNIGQRPRIQIAINSKTDILCFGGNTGAITVTASGGTGTLNYAWQTTPTVNNQSISNLSAGSYTIRITDANSCQRDSIITLTQPNQIVANEGKVDNLCFGAAQGKFYATPSGGIGPYDFSWYVNNPSGIPISNSTNLSTDSITNQLAGLKYVIITDANNCADTAQITISQPAQNIISVDSTSNPSCFGSSDGFARIILNSVGTAPATISWSNGTSAFTTNTLGNGNHSVFFTDANSCVSNTVNFTLTEPTQLTASILSSTNVSCNGANDGSGILSITGGTSPYNISWTNTTQTNDTISGLSPNIYTATVTDANGCLATANFTITQPAVLAASTSLINNVLCNGGNTGAANATQTGGTGPYNYSWNTIPAQNTQTAVNLPEGIFTVTITDANGCTDSETITIAQPTALNASIGITNNVTCNAGTNGSTTVNAAGGTAPYSYLWNSGQTTASINNLTAGEYIVIVSDANNCTDSDTIEITQPNAIVVTTSQTNVACINQNTGIAIASANGGTGLLSYAWQTTPVQQNDTATGLIAGTYNVIVIDINGCQGTNSVIITQPATALTGSIVNQTNLTCFGANTGTAEVVGAGGTPPYTYSWNTTPVQNTAEATGLTAGTHIATISDANGCATTVNVIISQPVQINVNVTVNNNVSCFGGNNGQLTASASLGVAPYNYTWNTTPAQNNATATGLIAGSYTVTVVDAANCSSTGIGVITEPTQLTGTASLIQNATCNNGSNGSVIASAANGTAPYNYSWNGGAFSTNPLNQNLSAGIYTVTIRDANNCTITRSATVSEPDPIVVSFSNIQNVLCAGQNTGQATASAIGGSGSYSFSWNTTPIQNTATGTGLGAGTYTVKATDGAGCIDSNTVTINQTAPVTISFSNINNVSCNGGSNGSAQANVAGGTAPYQFIWNTTPAQNTQTATGLAAGSYTVSIIDANTCLASNSVTITQPNVLTANTINIQNISCNGSSDGQATANPQGGTAPYNYLWNTTPAQTTQTASNLAAGTYNVTITDANSCTVNTNATITDAQTLVIDETIVNPACSGDTIGSINISITGGTAPFNYVWTDGPTTQNRTNIEVGVYSVTVTDANGCSANESFILAAPLAITVNNVSTNATCNGEADGSVNLTVSGGTPPYTYLWSNGATTEDLTNVPAGTYCVTVLDVNNCRAESFSFSGNFGGGELFLPDDNGVNIYSTNIAVAGYGSSQTIQSTNDILEVCINMEHSFLGDLGIWLECPNGQSVNLKGSPTSGGGGGGRYLGSPIDDGFGPTLSQGIGAEYCFTNNPTFLTLVGQSAIVSSLVSTGTPTGLSLPAGTYRPQSTNFANFVGCPLNGNWTLKIKDFASVDNGWIFDWNIGFTPQISPDSCATVTEPAAIVVNATSTNVTCNGLTNGTASATATGGTGTLSYSWRRILPTIGPTINTQNITGRGPGRFVVTVTDANGCVGTDTVDITQPALLTSSINTSLTTNVSCNGGNNGSLTVVASGGTTPYTYLWNTTPNQTTSTASNLTAGSYTVQVRDANNCLTTSNATITQPSLLVANASVIQNVTCNAGNNGSATVAATGGTGAYSFSWNSNPVQTTQTATNLTAGTYTVSVTDANSCLKTSQVTITEPLPVNVTFTNITPVFCEGQNTGQATAVATGGNGNYSYLWQTTPVQTTATASNLAFGNIPVIVTDGLGCTGTNNVTISETAGITLNFNNINHLTCFGDNNGSATAVVTGGTAPFSFSWNTVPAQTTAILSNVSGGDYIITVTDVNLCVKSDTITINTPLPLILDVSNVQDVTCFGLSNGSATILASGGTNPYDYSWNTTPVQTTTTVNNLSSGTYIASVTDDNGCVTDSTIVISQPTQLLGNASIIQNATCNDDADGQAFVSVSGGTLPYSYSWNTNPIQTNDTANGLNAGMKIVTVLDANNCSFADTVIISEPTAINITFSNIVPVLCQGQNTGSATAIVTGGNGVYSYSWATNPIQTTATANNLPAGLVALTVTDGNGCNKTESVTIPELNPISISFSNINNLTCFDANNGSAQATVSGGTPPYTYSWNSIPAQNTNILNNVAGGSYILTVIDANLCSKQDTVEILTPPALGITLSNIQNIGCSGNSSGQATATAFGGTGAYTYTWNTTPIQNTQTAANLMAGTYIIQVEDAAGCTTDSSVTISQSTPIVANILSQQNVNCFGGNNGQAILEVLGGVPPYSISWNTTPIQTNDTIINLTAGVYLATITDAANCQQTASVTITEPTQLNVNIINQINNDCFGDSQGEATASITGGTTPYSVEWNTFPIQTNLTATGLEAGNYQAIITDANGCLDQANISITEPSKINISFSNIVNPTCGATGNGSVTANVSGGVTPYSYSWSSVPAQLTPTLSNVVGGNYTITITDDNNCIADSSISLVDPSNLQLSSVIDAPDCFGDTIGSINITITGGSAPFTYTWSNGANTEDLTNVTVGTYNFNVTDANNCQAVQTFSLQAPDPIQLSSTNIPVSCFGGNNGSVDLAVTGGTPPYNYSWTNGATTQDLTNVPAGNYCVSVLDANGCRAEGFAASGNFNGGTLFLPDGTGAVYTTSITISDYAPGQTFNSINDLAEICINMEHSFSGDLAIELECPNAQSFFIKGAGGGDINLGIPVIDILPGLNPAGTGFEYCWNNNPSFNTLNFEAFVGNNLVVAFPQNWAAPSGDTLSLPPGSYLTDTPISNLIGCPLNGTWTLRITDNFAIDNGYIFDWNIGFTPLIIPDSCVNVTEPTQLLVTTNQRNVSCNGNADGQATASATGGTPPYTFAWSNGVNNDTINNLLAGQYIVTITDFNGCVKQDTVIITQPQAIQLTATNVTNVNCFGDANGSATVTPTGGTAPYTYSWNTNPAQFTSTVNFLTAGTYTATVTDANNCSTNTQVIIGQNSQLQADITLNNTINCFNANNASVTLSGSGGATPYTFSWNTLPIQTTATLSNLGIGTYIGTVADANGCTAKDTILITQPSALTSTLSNQINVNCFGQSTGSVQVNATGGTAPYSYLWTPGNITTSAISNLNAGTYNVLITDANGCTTSNSATITQPSIGLSSSITTFNNISCNGGANGSATVSVIGGTPAYSVNWNTLPAQSGLTANNLAVGTYTATITDALGCVTNSQISIAEPNAISVSMINPTQPLCGVCNGVITASAVGGTGAYTYSWNTLPIQTGATATGLCPTTNYEVEVTDGNGCSTTADINLNPSVNILLNANVVDPPCNGISGGSITLAPSGGILPYSYSWSTGQTSESITGLFSGQYIVTISDNSGCSLVDTFNLVEPQSLFVTVAKTDITCNNLSNGQAIATATGGTPPYQYAWSNGSSNDTISNLNIANYFITVTDNNGCFASNSTSITQPTAINVNSAVTPSLCSSANGSIDNTISGGVLPYSLLWLDGPTSEDRSNLSSGIYSLIVSDANGCADTTDIAVSDSNGPVLNITQQNNLCANTSNGSFNLAISSGLAPYQISYQGGSFAAVVGTNFSQSNLSSGNYSGIIRDANNCQVAFSINITEPAAITAVPTVNNESCAGFSNGSISLNISGGTPTLNILWSNNTASTGINSLSAGTYSVIITDANLCQYLDTFEIELQPYFTVNVSTSDINCVTSSGSNTGTASVNTVGAGNPSILWSNNATTNSITGLSAGSYSVSVTNLGCVVTENFAITSTDSLKINTVSITNDPCFGAPCDGSITVAGQGGVPAYNYQWIGGPSSATFSGLCANNYSVSLTDNVGCTTSKTIQVTEPNSILVSGIVTNVNCAGANSGAINLTATGGTGLLNYTWSNGANTEDISNLSAGAYSVTISDATGCSKDTTFIITQGQVITTTSSLINPSCGGISDGAIDITVSGGAAPYTFLWNNGATTEDLLTISSGSYSVTITDANLCQLTANFNLTAPNSINVSLVSSTNGSCGGICDGAAEVTATGGNLPYTFSWTGGLGNSNLVTNVCPGSYTVSVFDAIGCSSSLVVNINTNSNIQLDTIVNDITCFGLNNGSISVNASGGTGTLNILWADGSTLANRTNLAPSIYTVTVTDAALCSRSQSFTIHEPQALSVNVLANNVNCFGDNTGTLTAFASGGVSPYDYQWNDALAQTSAAAINLVAGQYSVVVTDANGCSELISDTVTQNTQLNVTSTSIDATCGINDGSASSTVSGGVQPYIYSWNNGASTANINNVGAGIYTLSVSDNLGCTATTIAAVSNSNGPDFTSSITQSICSLPNGAIEYTIGAGSAPLSFQFNGGTTSSVTSGQVLNFTNLAQGLYSAVLTDNLGCITATVDTVTELAPITISINAQNNPVCGNANGSIDVNISGGTSPISIVWNSGQTTEDISGLSEGTYTITVTDANSCTATQSFTLINSVDLLLTLNASNVTCNNGVTNDGQASVQVGGGTAPYTYLWSNGAITSSITGIAAGNYTVTVTDFNGCARDTSLTITAPTPLNVNLVTSVNPICNGQASGQLGLVVTGGSGNYNYLWSNGNTTNSLSNVIAGTYSVIISDQSSASCNYLDTFQLTEPSAINISVLANVPSCSIAPLCNGLLAVNASGGSAPYTYNWTAAGGFSASNDTISQICAGLYNIEVTDNIGCVSTTSLTVGSGANIIFNLVTTDDTCGAGIGTATVNPTGGLAPYTVLWFGAISGNSISNLPAGSGYFVTITDAAGCSATEIFDINGSTPIIPNEIITFSACGQNIGEIALNPFGGTPPYTFSWNTGATSSTISNLAAGIYTATITDAGGCSTTSQFGVSDAFGPIVNILQVVDPGCGSQCDGLIEIEVFSSSLPVNISWSPNGQNTQLITNLCADTYIAQVTDAIGCVTVTPAIQLFNNPGFTVSSSVQNLTCAGSTSCNGSIDLTISGFSPFYNILWNDNSTDEDRDNLCAGQYIVEISDLFGCFQTDTFNILEPNVISANVNIRSVDCNGANNGAAFISVVGGTAPYQITWPGGFIELTFDTASIGGLSPGSYTVTVDDANNCGPIAYNFTIGEPLPLNLNAIKTDISCFGNADGSISINPTGGISPYNILWSNTSTANQISGLNVGQYYVDVTDNNGCLSTDTFQINEPLQLQTTTSVIDNVTCFGGNDGRARISINGGTAPYFYQWSPGSIIGATNDTISQLTAGTYTVIITDANNCSSIDSVIINQPSEILANFTSINPDCNAPTCDGSIFLNPTGGNPGVYTYNWINPAGQTNDTLNGLCAGLYNVIISDVLGCETSVQIPLSNFNGPVVSLTKTDVTCFGNNNGTLAASAVGTAPFTYLWSPVALIDDTISNLGAGIYIVQVTDNDGCLTFAQDTILEPNQIQVSISSVDAACGISDGSATATASGGVAPFSYVWSNNAITASITNLAAGNYGLTVTDATGCSLTLPNAVNIQNPNGPTILGFTITDASCNGLSDGSATVTVTGGTGAYSYQWTSLFGQIGATVTNLSAGTYPIQVSDANGCVALANAVVNEPAALVANPVITFPSCGLNDGSIALTPATGNIYNWSGGLPAGATQTGLGAGIYSVYISNPSTVCTDTITILLNNPAAPVIQLTGTDITCNGSNNGQIILTTSGGTTPINYLWNNGSTNDTISGLSSGLYTVEVTDGNGCIRFDTISISEPPAFFIGSTNILNAGCGVSCDAEATVFPSGGVLPYLFNWSVNPAQVGQTATGLCAGQVVVSVTDANGCSVTSTISINPGITVTASATVTNTTCGACNGEVTVSGNGGSGTYNFVWFDGNTNATRTGLCPGNYSVQIIDNTSGCSTDTIISISSDIPINETLTITDVSCNGAADGSASVTIPAGTQTYTIFWSSLNFTGNSISNLSGGVYPILITDQNGCQKAITATINEPSAIALNEIIINPDCGLNNGSISVNPTGGVQPYVYDWSTGGTTNSINNLGAGLYTLVITQANSCVDSLLVPISNVSTLAANETVTNVSCFNQCNGSISLNVTGGTNVYNFAWNNGATTDNISGLCEGTYSVIITDANDGCQLVKVYDITQPDTLLLIVNNIAGPICGNLCEGTATAIVSGGTTPYTFAWSNGENGSTAFGLCSGNANILITDQNGCTNSFNFVVPGDTPLELDTVLFIQPNCANNSGSISVIATGGTGPYNYQWSGASTSTNPNLTGINSGFYQVVVIDANLCSDTLRFNLEQINALTATANDDSTYCGDKELVLTGTSTGGATNIRWYDASNGVTLIINDTLIITPPVGVNVYVFEASQGTCFVRDTVVVTVFEQPIADAGADKSIKFSESTTIGGSPTTQAGNLISWSPNNNITSLTAANPTVTPPASGYYYLTVTSGNGCIAFDSVFVEVIPLIEFPNGFTPNSDGINDFWLIDNIENYPNAIVEVYSRWGEKIFSSIGYKTPWDGKYNGQELPVGTYYYIIDLKDGEKAITGPITIMR